MSLKKKKKKHCLHWALLLGGGVKQLVPGPVMGGTHSNFPQTPPLPRPRVTHLSSHQCCFLAPSWPLSLRSPSSLPAFQRATLKPNALRRPLQPLPASGSSQNLPAQPASKEVTLMNLFQNQQASPCLAPTSPPPPSQAQPPLCWYLPPPTQSLSPGQSRGCRQWQEGLRQMWGGVSPGRGAGPHPGGREEGRTLYFPTGKWF